MNNVIAELKRVQSGDLSVLETYAIAVMCRNKFLSLNGGMIWGSNRSYYQSHCEYDTIFGSLRMSREDGVTGTPKEFISRFKYEFESDPGKTWIDTVRTTRWRLEKNGIEILNTEMKTYDIAACGGPHRITVKELKEACKKNGIKTTKMDKKALVHALMKC